MNELRLTIIFAFVVLFWGWVLTIYAAVCGEWAVAVVATTALIPATLAIGMKAREDWDS